MRHHAPRESFSRHVVTETLGFKGCRTAPGIIAPQGQPDITHCSQGRLTETCRAIGRGAPA
jgi:hypothetical protein